MRYRKHAKKVPIDPLYAIFEQHLFNFEDSDIDRKTFIANIVRDYILFLRRKNLSIPKAWEAHVNLELEHMVHSMLVKRIYGTSTIEEFRKTLTDPLKRVARARYAKLG